MPAVVRRVLRISNDPETLQCRIEQGTAAGLAMAFAAGYVADRVDRPHLKPSVNTGVVTSVGALTIAVIAVVSCFVRM